MTVTLLISVIGGVAFGVTILAMFLLFQALCWSTGKIRARLARLLFGSPLAPALCLHGALPTWDALAETLGATSDSPIPTPRWRTSSSLKSTAAVHHSR